MKCVMASEELEGAIVTTFQWNAVPSPLVKWEAWLKTDLLKAADINRPNFGGKLKRLKCKDESKVEVSINANERGS